jgi:hypothetical protein
MASFSFPKLIAIDPNFAFGNHPKPSEIIGLINRKNPKENERKRRETKSFYCPIKSIRKQTKPIPKEIKRIRNQTKTLAKQTKGFNKKNKRRMNPGV